MVFKNNNLEKDHLDGYNFLMKNSCDISFSLIRKAEKTINRIHGINLIDSYIQNKIISYEIEKGLFEFSLLYIICQNLDKSRVASTYYYELYNICRNLDRDNTNICNYTLLDAIQNNEIKPFMVVFLSPQQMHPERWKIIIQKRMRNEDAIFNIETVDTYECPKCFERKCNVIPIQLRCADEPESLFVLCTVCCHTVVI